MARPRTFSDDDLLAAARRVLLDRGPQGFTLTDAADAAGISRPALIQRFGSREALLRALALRETETLTADLAALPPDRGRKGTWLFLTDLALRMEAGAAPASRAAMVAVEAADPELARLAAERDRMLREAIEQRLPGDAPEGTAALLQAIIAGAALQWAARPEGALADLLLIRLRGHLGVLWPRQALALPGAEEADQAASSTQTGT